MHKDELERVVRKALLKCESRCLDDLHDFNIVLSHVTNDVFEFAAGESMKRRLGAHRSSKKTEH